MASDGVGALHFEAFDLTEIDAIPAFVRELRAQRGPIYGLVNNAGVGTEGLLATMRERRHRGAACGSTRSRRSC